VHLYDLANLPSGLPMPAVDSALAPSSSTAYFEGLDSVALTNDYAATLTHPTITDGIVYFWRLNGNQLDALGQQNIVSSRPTDITITPDGSKVIATGNSSMSVYHLATGARGFEHFPVAPNPYYQWCDGAAATNEKAVGVGQNGPQSGWVDVVDMTPIFSNFCASNPNSTGRVARVSAMGTASVSANNLNLLAEDAPAGVRGRFVYGLTQAAIPFFDGVQCIAQPSYGLRVIRTNLAGAAFMPVNYLAQPNPAAQITPGSTWHFQFVFLDPASSGAGINTSNGLSIAFGP
jgi:hypothetical protein